jgi:hypothetical protein
LAGAPATKARNRRSDWLGEPHWRNGYAREAVAALIDYGLWSLGMETIRAYTDPSNLASQQYYCTAAANKSARSN